MISETAGGEETGATIVSESRMRRIEGLNTKNNPLNPPYQGDLERAKTIKSFSPEGRYVYRIQDKQTTKAPEGRHVISETGGGEETRATIVSESRIKRIEGLNTKNNPLNPPYQGDLERAKTIKAFSPGGATGV